ncbi:glutathionylspermidine synthase family protein [Neobacillus sp. PS3-40]|uniref:glutathionylspermidine synthase family protein n=1 Tax=Neobacillus sp. PS3-40 TaxID=3070679 RepID=UPI0035A9AA02
MSSSYNEKRSHFYSRLENFWPDLYGEEYALYDIRLEDSAEIKKIRLASARIGHIFFKVCRLLREVPDTTLLEMGYPAETLPFLRLKTLNSESVIARLDLIRHQDSYKCIEINADTPTFIKELYHINGKVCKEFGVEDLNEGLEKLLGESVYQSVIKAARQPKEKNPTIVFTAHEDSLEDRETVLYLKKISGLPSRFVPLHKLQIEKDKGLYDEFGRKIDILYRQTVPIENLISDEDSEGNKIGLWLLDLVQSGKLAVVNPPSAFLLQNKAVQAVIWGLHQENHLFFTEKEHGWIEEYFLPTFLEEDYFFKSKKSYVKKPSFGREGDTVEIFTGTGKRVDADPQTTYKSFQAVYQEYIELPSVTFTSEKGVQDGRLLIGCFLLNGKPAAVGFRVGGQITNNLSYYLPAGLKRGEQ